MAASEAPWFVVRPGAQRKGKRPIKLPLRYLGKEILTGAEVAVSGERIVGVSTQGGGYFNAVDERGSSRPIGAAVQRAQLSRTLVDTVVTNPAPDEEGSSSTVRSK